MKIIYQNRLIDFRLAELHGIGYIRLRDGVAVDQNGMISRFDSLILRPSDFEIVEATENELRILEEAVKKIPEKVSKPRSKPEIRFWRIDFEPPKLPKGSRKLSYKVVYYDPFSSSKGYGEVMRGGGSSYLYAKAPFPPRGLFIEFKIKGKIFRIPAQIKRVIRLWEVVE